MGDDPDDRRETIALVTDELDRMARIVDDLLLMAKADQPDFVRVDTVEVADLTADLLAKARTLAHRDWTLDAAAVGEIQVDRQRVTQAVLNLARNAVEHTSTGAIAIGSAWHADGLHLWVRDEGPGVDAADRDRIFDRFARGAGPRRSDGAGLGLAIVRSVAEAHGGRVELESRQGEGATFTIVLPGRPPPPEPADIPTTPDDGLATPDQADPTEPIPVVGSDEPTREIRPSREPTT
jgi:signal transduction histidine kinase